MKAAELRGQSLTELKSTLSTALRDQFRLRLQGSAELQKPHQVREIRRNIARMLTILAEKEGSKDE